MRVLTGFKLLKISLISGFCEYGKDHSRYIDKLIDYLTATSSKEVRKVRLLLKCDGTRAETTFRLSAKRTSPFKSVAGRQFSRLLAAEVCASAVVMLDTPCSEVV